MTACEQISFPNFGTANCDSNLCKRVSASLLPAVSSSRCSGAERKTRQCRANRSDFLLDSYLGQSQWRGLPHNYQDCNFKNCAS
jgi:hypothetical protein